MGGACGAPRLLGIYLISKMHTNTIQKIQKAYIKTYEKDVKIYKDIENSQGTLLLQKCRPLYQNSRRCLYFYICFSAFLHMFMCICIFFVYFCMYFWIFSYKIDRLMGGGRLRRPPLINYQFYMKKIQKCIQKHEKIYTNTHKKL